MASGNDGRDGPSRSLGGRGGCRPDLVEPLGPIHMTPATSSWQSRSCRSHHGAPRSDLHAPPPGLRSRTARIGTPRSGLQRCTTLVQSRPPGIDASTKTLRACTDFVGAPSRGYRPVERRACMRPRKTCTRQGSGCMRARSGWNDEGQRCIDAARGSEGSSAGPASLHLFRWRMQLRPSRVHHRGAAVQGFRSTLHGFRARADAGRRRVQGGACMRPRHACEGRWAWCACRSFSCTHGRQACAGSCRCVRECRCGVQVSTVGLRLCNLDVRRSMRARGAYTPGRCSRLDGASRGPPR